MLKLKAYAKINLTLDIIGKREDGYHDLCMIMHTIHLYDTITITEKKSGGIRLVTNLPYLPVNQNNLVVRAVKLFFDYNKMEIPNLQIHLKKHIPVGAGLAGGSSDAATVLVGLNQYYDKKIPKGELMALGKQLGADVPYCIMGGTALAEGIGDILTPLPCLPNCFIVLAKPKFSLSTPAVFGMTDVSKINLHPDTKGMITALKNSDLPGVSMRMYNVLEESAKKVIEKQNLMWGNPRIIEDYKRMMMEFNTIGTVMSGSGPTVFGLFEKERDAQDAVKKFRKLTPDAFLTTTQLV